MPLTEILRVAFEALWANRFRALLTMLGLIIGVLAVVLLVSIGNGAKNYIFTEFQTLGTNLIIVQPGKTDKKSSMGPPIGAAQRKMTLADVEALEKRAVNLEAVTGLILGSASVRYEDAISNVNVFGTNDTFTRILNVKPGQGRFFTREEDEVGRRLIVLGDNVAWNLFGTSGAVGKKVSVNHTEFRVLGVMEHTGSKLGFSFDDLCYVPTTAAQRLFNDDKLFGIRARAKSRSSMDDAVDEIKEILKERRDNEEDFTVLTEVSMMETMDTILNMLTYVLGGIATISMLVAGIGIMNIMLVSVAERTQEIGIRRAVGARRRDILRQFLAEALVLSLSGGLAGLLLAVTITHIVYYLLPSFDMRAPLWVLAPAFVMSLLVGVVFGVWPALGASKIEPLDALRHE